MDDRLAEFLILLDEMFAGAALANLQVEVVTADGSWLYGRTDVPAVDDQGINATSGAPAIVMVGEDRVATAQIVACTVHAPA